MKNLCPSPYAATRHLFLEHTSSDLCHEWTYSSLQRQAKLSSQLPLPACFQFSLHLPCQTWVKARSCKEENSSLRKTRTQNTARPHRYIFFWHLQGFEAIHLHLSSWRLDFFVWAKCLKRRRLMPNNISLAVYFPAEFAGVNHHRYWDHGPIDQWLAASNTNTQFEWANAHPNAKS